ncbi:MAG TPA: SsrA-binding protein SmpB [Thermomicrobiaceae bacterium]|nr:SsrA-binding protein SmpB [Thermomicrobiaceae bacterium]
MARTKVEQAAGGERVITVNRKAFHDYHIEQEIEAGLVLRGTEIKSVREGRVNLRDAYARIENGELWLIGAHISPYEHSGAYFNHEPDRPRKLLVHRRELDVLRQQIEAKGMTLIPLRLALRKGRAKIDLALARGKKLYDKRDALAERDARRAVERALREQ